MSEKEKLMIEINQKIQLVQEEIAKKKVILDELRQKLRELDEN